MRSKEHNSWRGMMDRCYNPSHKSYSSYGGRGITVCERWHTFENFLEDMGKRPDNPFDKFSLDRIDNNGNYEPTNCKWSTYKEQANNTQKSLDKTKKCIDCNDRNIERSDNRCTRCSMYFKYHGKPRPNLTILRNERTCSECKGKKEPFRKGLCDTCYARKRRAA